MNSPWKILSKKSVYANDWIDVTHHEVITPSGEEGIYGTVHAKNIAIGILPLSDDGYTWIVGQYRFPLKFFSWELPEGGCPLGQEPIEAAKRELKEETGLTAKSWGKMMSLHLSNCVSDEVAHCYVAKDLTMGESDPDPTEELKIERVKFSDLFNRVRAGEITDAMTVAMVMRARLDRIA